jgi:hypothetical protein
MYAELGARLDILFRQAKDTLVEKGEIYGDSWKLRGGIGAFMMLARKWDRIEIAAKRAEYDIFKALNFEPALMDDIQDLRNYLTLVEDEVTYDERRENNALISPSVDRS